MIDASTDYPSMSSRLWDCIWVVAWDELASSFASTGVYPLRSPEVLRHRIHPQPHHGFQDAEL